MCVIGESQGSDPCGLSPSLLEWSQCFRVLGILELDPGDLWNPENVRGILCKQKQRAVQPVGEA